MRALNAIDVPPAGSIPSERSRATTSASATIVASARCNRSMISGGVRAEFEQGLDSGEVRSGDCKREGSTKERYWKLGIELLREGYTTMNC